MRLEKVVMALLLLSLSLCCVSCQKPARSGILIDRYRSAECVTPTLSKGFSTPTRGWDAEITLNSGMAVKVKGFDSVSGIITIHYLPDGPELTAVKPGDYIYPTDVRVDKAKSVLYVRADGTAAGIWRQTWLYEYDLLYRKEISRTLVDPSVLPPNCPM
jgi:hypothetical protein